MNRQNIVSAGWMMAIVAALLGAFYCGATAVQASPDPINPQPFELVPFLHILPGGVLSVCGVVLMIMFGRVGRRPSLGTPILLVGIIIALLGAASVVLVYQNPFSWMMAIVGLAIFIDALCLKISLSSGN